MIDNWKFPECKLLDINLSTQEITKKTLDSDTYQMYPGGTALATYLLLKEMKSGVDPLGPENMLVFSAIQQVDLLITFFHMQY